MPGGASEPADTGPALSVVLCTRNRAEQLSRTLQTWGEVVALSAWELVIIDNASTDATAEVLSAARPSLPMLRIGHAETIGLGAAREVGWRSARAPVIAFTDDDCYPDPDYVDSMRAVFDEDPGIAFMGGQIQLFDPRDLPETIDLRTEAQAIGPRTFLAPGSIQGANFACRRDRLEAVGGFDVSLGAGTPFPCEDIDLIARIVWAGGRGTYDPRPVVRHHHGRRTKADLTKLVDGYAAGRGGYYAKFLMRRDTRFTWAKAWLRSMLRLRSLRDLRLMTTEVRLAHKYFTSYR